MARATRSSAIKAEASKASPVIKQEPMQLSSPPATPVPRNARKRKAIKEEEDSEEPAKKIATSKKTKRAKNSVVKEESINDLPHGLGAIGDVAVRAEIESFLEAAKVPQKSKKTGKTTKVKKEQVDNLVAKATTTDASPKKKAKAKGNAYGLTPGQTPYPNWPHPTAEECEEVTRLLSAVHGKVEAPKTIPLPSLEVSGCGEVPSVLDALIRTRLSAATSGANSSRAFAGLVSKFGILKSGIGKGSVNWNKVRLADQKEIFEAIKSGGLADVKSKDIKKILQMVWEENQQRKNALKSETAPPDSTNEQQPTVTEKAQEEVEKAENDVISLDHLHLLSSDEAFTHLTSYPGIGPKTASCVLLFCLQRPSFAVDTHVFRLCKWLGWVPPPGDPAGLAPGVSKGTFSGPTRNSTYAHCEVRVPDHLKYPLHQLLIRHGKTCPRCRAITGEGSAGWEKGCPIEHLVRRSGGRKGEGEDSSHEGNGGEGKTKKMAKGKGRSKRGRKVESEDESEALISESEAESSVLSDLGSDEEEGEASESEESDFE